MPRLLGCARRVPCSIVSAQPAPARQNNGQRITPNFKDAEIGQVIEAVAPATGKTIILDPRVRAQVTMLSQTPMTPDAFYEAFLAMLQVHEFVAVRVRRHHQDRAGRERAADAEHRPAGPRQRRLRRDRHAGRSRCENVSAAQLVPVLRPLMPQAAHMAAYPAATSLIISDRASNVARIMRIIRRIDQAGDNDVDIIPLQTRLGRRSRARGQHASSQQPAAAAKAAAARRRA